MNRTTLKVSILVISLLVFQFGIPRPISPLQVDTGIEPVVQAIQAPVNSITSFELNDTDSEEVLEISILDPGIYLLNLSLFVDEAAPNLDLDAEYYQSMDWWWPQIGGYIESLQSFDTMSWNNVPVTVAKIIPSAACVPSPGKASSILQISSPGKRNSPLLIISNLSVLSFLL